MINMEKLEEMMEAVSAGMSGKPLVAAVDVESTLTGLEGWEVLAREKGVEGEVREMRERAMRGEMDFRESFFERARIVLGGNDGAGLEDLEKLQEMYVEEAVAGARELIGFLQERFERVVLISGGVREALLGFVRWLGVEEGDFFAIPYGGEGFPEECDLYFNDGKARVLRGVIEEVGAEEGWNLMIGDGMTDAAAKSGDVRFVAVGGHPEVLAEADYVLESFV